MPSITKSLSIMFLVSAATNVLAAPPHKLADVVSIRDFSVDNLNDFLGFKSTGADRAKFCIIKKSDGTTLSISGISDRLFRNGKDIDGCSKDQLEKCKDMETDDDRRKAMEMCPELETCGKDRIVIVWEKCMKKCKKEGKCDDDDDDDKKCKGRNCKDDEDDDKKCKGRNCDDDDDDDKKCKGRNCKDDEDDDKKCKGKACKKEINVKVLSKEGDCPCTKNSGRSVEVDAEEDGFFPV